MSKCHIVGKLMLWLISLLAVASSMYGLSILTYDREPLIIIIAFFYVCVVIQCLYVFVLYVGL